MKAIHLFLVRDSIAVLQINILLSNRQAHYISLHKLITLRNSFRGKVDATQRCFPFFFKYISFDRIPFIISSVKDPILHSVPNVPMYIPNHVKWLQRFLNYLFFCTFQNSNEKCSIEDFAVYFLNFIRNQTEE